MSETTTYYADVVVYIEDTEETIELEGTIESGWVEGETWHPLAHGDYYVTYDWYYDKDAVEDSVREAVRDELSKRYGVGIVDDYEIISWWVDEPDEMA